MDSSEADEFLAFPIDSEANRYNRQDRITQLGHKLFALRECNGYEAFISSLKSRDLAPAFFELWAANTFYENSFAVEFIKTKGQKGEDYDLLIVRNEATISVEVKSRRDGIILGENTLSNTLGKARKQLPSSGPSIIVVSIPNEWALDSDAEEIIKGCINRFFRNSTRVNYIILVWLQWIELKTGKANATYIRQYDNPNAGTPVPLRQVVQPLKQPINSSVLKV